MTLAPVASASVCYFVLRRITGVGWPAAVAALIYGFGPFFQGQSGHLHLIFAVFPPLILYFGHLLFVSQSGSPARAGCWFGLNIGLQLITGEEVVVLTAVCATFAVAVLAIVNRGLISKSRVRYASIGVGVGAGVSALVAAVPLWFQFFGRNSTSGGISSHEQRLGVTGLYTPSQLEYFSTPATRVLNATRMFANPVENTGYLGWPLIFLSMLICGWLIWRRERFVWWWILTAAFTVVLSLGSQVDTAGGQRVLARHSLWSLLSRVPLLDGVIAVRFTLITTLMIALLLTWGLSRLPRGR